MTDGIPLLQVVRLHLNADFRRCTSMPDDMHQHRRHLQNGERVIVNTEDMSQRDIVALKSEGVRRGWGDKVVYVNANPIGAVLPPPGAR